MLIALDQTARATVDQARTVEAMRDVLASVLGGAREDAREARRRRRRRRLRAAAGGGEEGKREGGKKEKDEEEEYRVAGAVGDGVAGRYEVEFGRWEGEYEALDLWTKYYPPFLLLLLLLLLPRSVIDRCLTAKQIYEISRIQVLQVHPSSLNLRLRKRRRRRRRSRRRHLVPGSLRSMSADAATDRRPRDVKDVRTCV